MISPAVTYLATKASAQATETLPPPTPVDTPEPARTPEPTPVPVSAASLPNLTNPLLIADNGRLFRWRDAELETLLGAGVAVTITPVTTSALSDTSEIEVTGFEQTADINLLLIHFNIASANYAGLFDITRRTLQVLAELTDKGAPTLSADGRWLLWFTGTAPAELWVAPIDNARDSRIVGRCGNKVDELASGNCLALKWTPWGEIIWSDESGVFRNSAGEP